MLRFLTAAGLALVAVFCLDAEVSGKQRITVLYEGETRYGAGDRESLRIEIEIEKITFALNQYQGYRIVRLRARNYSEATFLDLSRRDDSLVLTTRDGARIEGLLDLSRNAAVWDSLDSATRKALAYPVALEPESTTYFYVMFPADQVRVLPREFFYTIAGLNRTVEIRERPVAAR
jgi:hypothetical protein